MTELLIQPSRSCVHSHFADTEQRASEGITKAENSWDLEGFGLTSIYLYSDMLSMDKPCQEIRSGHAIHKSKNRSGCLCCCSVTQLCPTLCNPMNCNTPGLLVLYYLPQFAQTHVHWHSDTIQPSHPLSSPSPLSFNLSQHQGLFQWIGSSHQVAKVLGLQLQHQSFQWIFRTDFLWD